MPQTTTRGRFHFDEAKGEWICDSEQCGHTTKKRDAMYAHWRWRKHEEKAPPVERPFACSFPGCDRKYVEKKGLREHENVQGHRPEREGGCIRDPKTQRWSGPCRSKGCTKDFKRQGYAANHAATCQGKVVPPHCGRTAPLPVTQGANNRYRVLACGNHDCLLDFSNPENARRHYKRKHPTNDLSKKQSLDAGALEQLADQSARDFDTMSEAHFRRLLELPPTPFAAQSRRSPTPAPPLDECIDPSLLTREDYSGHPAWLDPRLHDPMNPERSLSKGPLSFRQAQNYFSLSPLEYNAL